jgi:hypothetical protein
MFRGKDVDSTILMATGNELAIGRLHTSVGAIERKSYISWTYQVNAGAEAAFGLVVSYLCAIRHQIPHADVTILRDACEILSVLRQSHRPYVQFAQIGWGFLIST